MIIGELALGALQDRQAILGLLADLPSATQATHLEVLSFVEAHALFGIGLSLVDAHLLAALRLSPSDRLWTRNRRLRSAATGSGCQPTSRREDRVHCPIGKLNQHQQ